MYYPLQYPNRMINREVYRPDCTEYTSRFRCLSKVVVKIRSLSVNLFRKETWDVQFLHKKKPRNKNLYWYKHRQKVLMTNRFFEFPVVFAILGVLHKMGENHKNH